MLVCFSLRAGFADFPFTANCSGVVIPSHRQLSNTAATYRQLFAPDNAEYSMTARISSGATCFYFQINTDLPFHRWCHRRYILLKAALHFLARAYNNYYYIFLLFFVS